MFTSPHFHPIELTAGRNLSADGAAESGCGESAVQNIRRLPLGKHTFWGIPFNCGEKFVYVNSGSTKLDFNSFTARYLIFLHASETPAQAPDEYGIYKNYRGMPQLMEPICDYIIHYEDDSEIVVPIRARMEINDIIVNWGSGAFLSKPHMRGHAITTATEDIYAGAKPDNAWGNSQTRVNSDGSWINQWLYAFENPKPKKAVKSIDIVKKNGNVFLFGVTAGDISANPLRYGRRQKVLLSLTGEARADREQDSGREQDRGRERDRGCEQDKENVKPRPLDMIGVDLGQIISVTPRPIYDNGAWEDLRTACMPEDADDQYIVEFSAHEDAILYLGGKCTQLPVADIVKNPEIAVAAAEHPVTLKVRDANGKPVPVRVHAHGAAGEYLPPRNRHRIPNPYWFEDYSTEYVQKKHWSTYIDGTAQYLLPPGEVYVEVSKGFEIKPVRRRFVIDAGTREICITLEKVVDWRAKGWVTADTHVHFLSPHTALLEGEAEGVNVVNLLASQWGELFTNIGDFTGAGELSNGEHMVRVGTENRQHLLGHISLLGYDGDMILPLTTDGPDESALGDPMEMTLTQWAAQCRSQNGLSILPHFPNPRAEAAAAIVSELIDGVEVVRLGAPGINPYYLSDWYRYLNCGYHVAAVGGTDKMSAGTAIGEMRTYALLDGPLTYRTWKEAVLAGRTFTTSGALVNMKVEGKNIGSTLQLPGAAGITIAWDAASAVIPITSVELVMNGETIDIVKFDGMLGEKNGYFSVNIKDSAWFALRVRGLPAGGAEVITAHTSAVFVIIDGKPVFNAPDAATILDQIESATAYVKILATKARESQFKLALAALSGAHRALHNKMHAAGHYHNHNPEEKHDGH